MTNMKTFAAALGTLFVTLTTAGAADVLAASQSDVQSPRGQLSATTGDVQSPRALNARTDDVQSPRGTLSARPDDVQSPRSAR